MADITGWGRGTWSQGAWDEPIPVVLTGESATGAVGSVTATGEANVPSTGISATGAVGSVTVQANADVNVIGNSAFAETVRSGGFTAYAQAQLSTARSKFGPSSLATDGSLDLVFSNETCVFGSGDFTVEMWVYRASNPATSYFIFDNRIDSNNGTVVVIDNLGRFRLIVNGGAGGSIFSSSTSTGVWNHVAIVRNGTDLSLYINGTSAGSVTNSTDYSNRKYGIGAGYFTLGYLSLPGNIDEFRASTVARYTTNFTPATAEFSPDVNTEALLHFDGANGSTQITNSATFDLITVTGEANVFPTAATGTGAAGTATVSADANIALSGESTTGAVGFATVVGEANIALTGLSATGEVGTTSVEAEANVPTTGLVATTNTGTVTVAAEANVTATGEQATVSEGSVTVQANADVAVTGLAAQALPPTGVIDIRIDVTVPETGLPVTGSVGTVSIKADADVSLTGTNLAATGQVGNVFVWGEVDPNRSQTWTQQSPSQSPGWSEITPSQSPGWEDIAA